MPPSTAENVAKLIDLVAELNSVVGRLGEVGVQISLGQRGPNRDHPLGQPEAEIYFHLQTNTLRAFS